MYALKFHFHASYFGVVKFCSHSFYLTLTHNWRAGASQPSRSFERICSSIRRSFVTRFFLSEKFHMRPLIASKRTLIINPRRACAARVTVVGLSLCVCLAPQAARRPISDASGFRTTRAWKIKGRFSWNDCVREICRENKRNSQYSY